MFLDGKQLQITQSYDTTNYLRSVLHAQPGSDLPPKLHVPVKDAELPPQATRYKLVHLCATYTLKLHVLVHSFAACQRCGATFESYTLQTRPIYLCATYAVTLHVRESASRSTEDSELPPQGRPGPREWRVYKRQAGQR